MLRTRRKSILQGFMGVTTAALALTACNLNVRNNTQPTVTVVIANTATPAATARDRRDRNRANPQRHGYAFC